jgi:hypothetical protein
MCIASLEKDSKSRHTIVSNRQILDQQKFTEIRNNLFLYLPSQQSILLSKHGP